MTSRINFKSGKLNNKSVGINVLSMFIENPNDVDMNLLTGWYNGENDSLEIFFLGKDFGFDVSPENYELIKSHSYLKVIIHSNGNYNFESSLSFLKGDDIKFKVKEFDYFEFHKFIGTLVTLTN